MSELRYDGRVAIVTGAGHGLGRQHALELAARGAKVVVNDLGGDRTGAGASAGPAQDVVEEIKKNGGEAVANPDNVATEDGARAIVQTALDAFGKLDILINNAGILRDKSFKNMSPEVFDSVLAVHLRGSFLVASAAWPHLRDNNYGRIVNTSSPAGIYGNFGQANYATAKMGLIGFTKTLGQEGAKYNIKANAIAPVAATRMTEDLLPADFLGKLGVEKVTPLVAYLVHESNEETGQVYTVGGGRIAKIFIGEGPGYGTNEEISAELVRDNWDAINAREPLAFHKNPAEQMGPLIQQLSS
jgi:NAD(P)-dependent dehydrogenase (short-subunit alcohol dehydrogenase family)